MARYRSRLETPVVCDDPKPIVKKCVGVIGRQLANAGKVGFLERAHARSELEFLLLSSRNSWARARQEYPVLYFEATPSRTYWLAIALRFAPLLERFKLIQVSLVLFEGTETDPEKSPLLRAEWDDLEEAGVHAQPHWHVYKDRSAARSGGGAFPAVSSGPIVFSPQAAELEDPERIGLRDRPRFHYAMAARWHLEEGGSCRSSLSAAGLMSWLDGCIDYIRGQLPHISREELLE